MSDPRLQRIEELSVDRALVGLSSVEQLELEGLLAATGRVLDEEIELAAAALDQALVARRTELPPDLRARLAATAASVRPPTTLAPVRRVEAARPRSAPLLPAWTGWLVAAAAALVALIAWLGRDGGLDPDGLRATLLASTSTLRLDWSEPGTPSGASGDVVWSQERQQGVMRIAGLAPNDPKVEQYQLWIFDETQEHPVDGGVFDVAAGEVLIPIDAKLTVARPKLFAITREKPGGVVVSDQKRIVLVAPF